ncbi:MAG: succinate dehydrogenase [Pseudomonadota bacterium]
MNLRLYLLQRVTAALMLPLVLGHLVVIFYATSTKLTAADILGRTEGSIGWALFYGAFVCLVAVHGAIGFATIAREWFGARGQAPTIIMWTVGVVLLLLGLRAVFAVTMPGGLS